MSVTEWLLFCTAVGSLICGIELSRIRKLLEKKWIS
jgi:hypothetical protein